MICWINIKLIDSFDPPPSEPSVPFAPRPSTPQTIPPDDRYVTVRKKFTKIGTFFFTFNQYY